VLDFVFRPLRSVLGAGEREMSKPLHEPEHDLLDAVKAIERASDSIERHVEVIESLATSVGPLTDSVNKLTATMVDLVGMLAPVAEAEKDMEHAEHFLGFRRRRRETGSEAGSTDS
jgi:hypothetical protein